MPARSENKIFEEILSKIPAKKTLNEKHQKTYNEILEKDPLTLKFYIQLCKEDRFSKEKQQDGSYKILSPNEVAKKVYDYIANPENYDEIELEMRKLVESLEKHKPEALKEYERHLKSNDAQNNLLKPEEIKEIQSSINQAITSNKSIKNHNGKQVDSYSEECYGIMFEKDEIARKNLENLLAANGIGIQRERTWLWGAGVRKKTLAATSIIHKFSEKISRENMKIKQTIEDKKMAVVNSESPNDFEQNMGILGQLKAFFSNLLFGKNKKKTEHQKKVEKYVKKHVDDAIVSIKDIHDINREDIEAENMSDREKNSATKESIKQKLTAINRANKRNNIDIIEPILSEINDIENKAENDFNTKFQPLNKEENGELSLEEEGVYLSDERYSGISKSNENSLKSAREKAEENADKILEKEQKHKQNVKYVNEYINGTKSKIDRTVEDLGLDNGILQRVNGLISLADDSPNDENDILTAINLKRSSINQTIDDIKEFAITGIDKKEDQSVEKIHYSMLEDDAKDKYIEDIDKKYEETINLIARHHIENKQKLKNELSNHGLSEENSLKIKFPSEISTITTVAQARQNRVNEVNDCQISKTGKGANCKITLVKGEYLSNKKTKDKLKQGKQEVTNELNTAKKSIKDKHDSNKERILEKTDKLNTRLKELERDFPKNSDPNILKQIEKRIIEQINDATQGIVEINNNDNTISLSGTYFSDNELQKREKILNCIEDYISLLEIEKAEEDIKNIKDRIEKKNATTKSGLHQTKTFQTDSMLRTQDRWYGIDNEDWSAENKDFTIKKEGANSHKLALRRIIEEDSTIDFNEKAISYNPREYVKINQKEDSYQGINPYKIELDKEKNRLSSLEEKFDDRIKQEETGVNIQVMIKKCRTEKQNLRAKKRLDVKYNSHGRKITRTKTYLDTHEDEWDTCISNFENRQKDKKDSKESYIDEMEKSAFITGNAAFIAANIERDIAIQEEKRKDAVKKLKTAHNRFISEFTPIDDEEVYTYYANEIDLCLKEIKFSDVSEKDENSSNDDAENARIELSSQTTEKINKQILEKRAADFKEVSEMYNDLYEKRFYIANDNVKLDIYPKILNKSNGEGIEKLPILMREREDGLAKKSKELEDLVTSKQEEIVPLQNEKKRIIFESALDNSLINGLNKSALSAKSSAESLKKDLMELKINLKDRQRRNLKDLQRDADLLEQKTAAFKKRLMNEYDRFSKKSPGEKFIMPNEAVEEIRQLKELQKSVDERKAGVDKANESKNQRFWAESTTNNHLDFSKSRSNIFIREELNSMKNKLKIFTYMLEEYDAEEETKDIREELTKRVDNLNIGGIGRIDEIKQKINKYEEKKIPSSKNTKITEKMMEIQTEYDAIKRKMAYFKMRMSALHHKTPEMPKTDKKASGSQQYTYRIQIISLNSPYTKMTQSPQSTKKDAHKVSKKVNAPKTRHLSFANSNNGDTQYYTNSNKSLIDLSGSPSSNSSNVTMPNEEQTKLEAPTRHATMINGQY